MANRETGARWDAWASMVLRGVAYHDTLNRSVGHEGLGEVSAQRDWYLIAEQPAPAPHLAHPEGCAALRIVLVTVPRVSLTLHAASLGPVA